MKKGANDRKRLLAIQVVMTIGAFVLIAKATSLQLINNAFRSRAQAIAIDKTTTYPSRGILLDRNGKLMISNNPMYDLMVTYKLVNPHMDTAKFCELLDIDKSTFVKNMNKDWKDVRFSKSVPFVFLKKLSVPTFAKLQEHLHEYPGFFPVLRNIRGYPVHAGAHLLGYISEVSPKDIEKGNGIYSPGDYIGAIGLEKQYEKYLRGKKGYKYQLKDNLGRIVGSFKDGAQDVDPVSGSDLKTSIDIDLQAYAEWLMAGKVGSVVAIEPKSGEILSMVSTPTYDPNLLIITRERGKTLSKLLKDPQLPFFDRSIMAEYPPGSVFKTVVSLIGLNEGVIKRNTGFVCNHGYFYAGHLYGCHGHRPVHSVDYAVQISCNSYFFQTLRKIVDQYGFYNPDKGLDRFVHDVTKFGLGHKLGIDFPNEKSGNIPTTAYYDKIYPKKLGGWKSPAIMSIGIGQGEIQLTTLQIANLAAIMANRGYFYTPHLVTEISDGTPIDSIYSVKRSVDIDRQYFEPVIHGMQMAVEAGTAPLARIPGVTICGKTGTVQNAHKKDHSVFFAFAPKDDPKIAIAVFVENAGWGGSYAAPIASLVAEKYIKGEIDPSRKALETRMHETVINTIEKKDEK
ncbi:MAG TPA: penicillin-binding protein 2 [Saprospiraceae bacterium]|nr:penicillin-binding protein 2 [Saprospiraceae bacterium]